MKRVGIDARLYFQTGVGVYIRNLLHYLEELHTDGFEFYVYLMDSDYEKIYFKNKNFIKRRGNYRWHSFAEQLSFLYLLYKDNLDLMHFTYFSHPIFYNRPFIATIHDTILLEHKTGKASTLLPFLYDIKHFGSTLTFTHQMRKSKAVITPTKTVKNQLLHLYGEQYEKKIFPIYEGVDYIKQKIEQNKELASRFQKEFIIYIGNFYPHKNVEQLIYAYSEIDTKINLLLIGPADFFAHRIQELIRRLHQEKRIVLYSSPTDSDLVYFYTHAQALIHPSLSEGFGLPLLEAAYFQLPILASDIPVFKEILQDRYVSFDPTSKNDMKEKMVSSFKNLKRLEHKNLLAKFSFPQMAKETFELYKQYV